MARPKASWTAEAVALLGTMSDSAVAKQLGIGVAAVRQARGDRGIPAHRLQAPARAAKPPKKAAHAGVRGRRPIELPTRCMQLLGAMPDVDIARKAGVSVDTVRRRRAEAGIPQYLPAPDERQALRHREPPVQTPEAMREARRAAKHTALLASAIARVSVQAWRDAEQGSAPLPRANWELYILLADLHPALQVVSRPQPISH